MNQILSVIAKFHIQYCFVTPTHFPPRGLFSSQQVIKLLECSTDSKEEGRGVGGGRALRKGTRGKIKREMGL